MTWETTGLVDNIEYPSDELGICTGGGGGGR